MSDHKLRADIVEFAKRVAARFRPEKIILFGSHAYGTPTADSDVDLLVVMPARDQIEQAVKIRWEFPAPFPLDLIVRTPKRLKRRLDDGDSFLLEIMARGIMLHEKGLPSLGAKSRGGSPGRRKPRSSETTAS
jgi:predicted nucleotidyltransferase